LRQTRARSSRVKKRAVETTPTPLMVATNACFVSPTRASSGTNQRSTTGRATTERVDAPAASCGARQNFCQEPDTKLVWQEQQTKRADRQRENGELSDGCKAAKERVQQAGRPGEQFCSLLIHFFHPHPHSPFPFAPSLVEPCPRSSPVQKEIQTSTTKRGGFLIIAVHSSHLGILSPFNVQRMQLRPKSMPTLAWQSCFTLLAALSLVQAQLTVRRRPRFWKRD